MAWATLVQARQHWADAVEIDDATLTVLLDVAYEQVHAYAPANSEPVTSRFMLANVYQAREIWAAGTRESDALGVGDFVIRVRPLTDTVKALLRPQRAAKDVG